MEPRPAIRLMTPGDFDTAAALVGRALADNPTQESMYRGTHEHRERQLQLVAGTIFRGRTFPGLVAEQDGSIVGLVAAAAPGTCIPPFSQQMTNLFALLKLGPRTAYRVLAYGAAWAEHEPKEPHWHVGPVGVEPALQSQGIGSALMAEFLSHADKDGASAFLETDTEANVRFYRRFGFEVLDQAGIYGTPYWFMRRPAAGEDAPLVKE